MKIAKGSVTQTQKHEFWLLEQLHEAGDGKWFVISMGQRAMFVRFCNEVLKRPDILESPRVKGYPNVPKGDDGRVDLGLMKAPGVVPRCTA